MARQGCGFSEEEIQKIVRLLGTDMTAQEIAARMDCSRSAVIAINRKFNVRNYGGRRTAWDPVEAAVNKAA